MATSSGAPSASDGSPSRPDIAPGTAALAKGLAIIDLIADAKEPLRFAELLRRSGLPKPTFARILRTLGVFGMVVHDEARGTYSLGPRFLELSHRVWERFDLESAARPELQRLAEDLEETVALVCIDGHEARYVDECSSVGLGVRVDAGRRVPLHCTAGGKAMLAYMEPSMARPLIAALTLDRYSPHTITERTALQSDLALTRARGYALSFEEHLEGVHSVAAVIAGQDGRPIGALVALGPSQRLDRSRIHPVGRELMAASRRITGASGAVAISSRPRPRSGNGQVPPDLQCVLPWGAQLGEAPVWNPQDGCLYWADILHPAVHRFDPRTGINDTCETGKLVSAVMPTDDATLLVATLDGLEWLDFDSGHLTHFAHPEKDIGENRLNDAKIGPGGAVWVGSMRLDASKSTGSLYRVTPDGAVMRLEDGLTVSNGLDWSPDGSTFYFVDTVPGIIHAYDSKPGTGRLSSKRVFAHIPAEEGRPDGLTVDADGYVWCAIWDGWHVRRYAPDGKLDRVVDLPVPRPTSVAFGDTDLATLYITSARTRLPASTLAEAPLSGGIFAFRPGVPGNAPRLLGYRNT